ncbi:MAG: hypothetical protein K0R18_581 [Bacillales bacterium]|nr:hypothetical protein [Bacillales bacterium]
MGNDEKLGIDKKYSLEILEIVNKLNQLESGRVYEISKAPGDGYLSSNTQQLRTMIRKLLSKINNQSPSVEDEFAVLFEDKSSSNK